MAGLGLGVGGAAAAGLESGFGMGLRADAANDARKQREFENARQTAADTERTAQLTRNNARQDTLDANATDDRALTGLNSQLEDARYQLGALHATYPDGNIPDTAAKPLYTQVGQLSTQRQALLAKRYQPVVDSTLQKWRDFSSKAEVGQADPASLRGQDLRDYIKATTGHDLSEFANGNVGSAINDATTGIQTNNSSLTVRAAGTLLAPQIKRNIGGTAPDGSQIIDKDLYALAPAPQQGMQPGQQSAVQANPIQGLTAALTAATSPSPAPQAGQDPNAAPGEGSPGAAPQPAGSGTLTPSQSPTAVWPVLQVTTRQPDGSLTTYHAPVTQNRSSDPNDPLAKPIEVSTLMDRMGRLGVVDNWLKTPEMAAAVQEALKSNAPTTFDQAWAAVHGDPKVLNGKDVAVNDPTSVKIAAIKKLAAEQYGGDFTAAAQAFMGHANAPSPTAKGGVASATPGTAAPAAGGVQAAMQVSSTDQAARDAEQLKILQTERTSKWEPALAAAQATGDPAKIKQAQGDLDAINREITRVQSAPATKPAAAGTAPPASPVLGAAPTNADPNDKKTVDFFAAADIAGDRQWRVGLARSKSGSALIEAVKRRIPQLAEEWGITPQDYGTINGQRAALNATLKQITSRVTANEMSADKVSRDMATYDSLIDGASADYGAKFINTPINALRRQFNDPKLAQLDLAANQVATEYERMITGGQLSVSQLHAGAQEEAKKLLNGDMPPPQARAVMQIMTREIQNAKDASHASLDSVTDKLRNLGGNPAAAPRTGTGLAPAPAAAKPAVPPAPAVGTVIRGFRYKGGDASQQANWEKV